MSAANIAAVTRVEETNVVVRAAPFQLTVELMTKLLPLTVSVAAEPPEVALDGLKLPITGAGLFTVVIAVALLLPITGSQPTTLAVLLVVPEIVGVTICVTVAVARLPIVPRLQV